MPGEQTAAARDRPGQAGAMLEGEGMKQAPHTVKVKIERLKVYFALERSLKDQMRKKEQEYVKAVDGVSVDIHESEVLGVVGETGCGKTTIANALLLMCPITEGKIFFEGREVNNLADDELMDYYSRVQLIWQNPFSSLNPRMKVYELISRPLIRLLKNPDRGEVRERINEIIRVVGLNKEDLKKYPHEFSGGGRQRIVIARALVGEPDFIIADEPTSSLDVSIQAQILNLLKELKNNFNLTMLFISHNLSVINFISNRVAVMYFGRIVELLPKTQLFTRNYHYYTRKLIDAIPKGRKRSVTGSIIEKSHRLNHGGCIYYYRCENAGEKCLHEVPRLETLSDDHYVACHYPLS
jgi:oligopeptide/dipeptide ABC transporter ATP-binding protein